MTRNGVSQSLLYCSNSFLFNLFDAKIYNASKKKILVKTNDRL